MYCLRDFDLVAAYKRPNLFRLYAEIPYAVLNNLSVENHVKAHVKNSNYGHQGDSAMAEVYEWHNYTSVLSNRFQHDMFHALLGVFCEEEGWSPFFADGNHQAEALVIQIEPIFRFWDEHYEQTLNQYRGDLYKHQVERYYEFNKYRDKHTFLAGWVAASKSDRPMTAFEARFLGVSPRCSLQDIQPKSGEKNKWGEKVPAFEIDEGRIDLFFERMKVVRQRMIDTLDQSPFDYRNKEVCQEFFKTLKMGELAKIISGENPDQELSYDEDRLRKAQLKCVEQMQLTV